MTQQAQTKYINILIPALHELHVAYPNEAIELRVHEDAPDSWQCYIEMRESGIKSQSESFHIGALPAAPEATIKAMPAAVPCAVTFQPPYPINPLEEEAVHDMMNLIVVMLKNGANAFELQQRLMGL